MAQQRTDLEEFFHPKAVALVGSVNRNANPDRLRKTHAERWGDRWYLVNAKGGQIGDIPVYEHVTDIPAEVTLAVVNVGTRLVTKVVEECGKHGVPYVLIFTAGFSEVGEPRAPLSNARWARWPRRYGIRVFGPNTNTNAFEVLPEPPRRRGGRIGLVTQSGHQGRPLVQGTEFGVAFSVGCRPATSSTSKRPTSSSTSPTTTTPPSSPATSRGSRIRPSSAGPSRPPTPSASRWWRSRWEPPRPGRGWPARTPATWPAPTPWSTASSASTA